WQITDQGPREGNYLEGSGSAMFVYTVAKAVNQGYLPREPYATCARRGFQGLVAHLIKTDEQSHVSLTQICEGAGLGYTTAKGIPRDGSYKYYLSEPIVSNDPKGTGPFILAGIQLEKLLAPHAATENHAASDEKADIGWGAMGDILSRIHAPFFPNRDFPITNFGARPGESATRAIRAAIEACSAAGGGRVVIPAGEWESGAIRLKSGVNLHVDDKATLKFSTNFSDYPNVFTRWEGIECYNYSAFIYAFEEHDIAVTGNGTLDGQASDENWWSWKKKRDDAKALNEMGQKGIPVEQRVFGAGHFLRPDFIETYRCKNVLIEGVSIVRSPMWELHPTLSENVIVRDVRIHSHGPNNDGCDPESSRDVLIDRCVFDTGDDCIAIKSGRNNDGRRVNVPSENIVIRGCTMLDGHGGIVIGSEVSGGCRNVFAEDCKMDSPMLDRVLRFKSNAERGGAIENVFLRRVQVGQVTEAILTVDLMYEEGAKGSFPPTIRNVSLEQVTGEHVPRVLWIDAFPAATVDNITFRDCTFRGLDAAELVANAGRITFDHVSIEPAHRHDSLNSRKLP
ncbi:MAG TPA: glycosyl hydrolase family 28 protein, partial [Opitutaceae bacterium]